MEKILYFDYIAVPIYAIMLYASYARGMTKGRSNHIFNLILLSSLIAAISDIAMELFVVVKPVSTPRLIVATFFTYIYFLSHNGTTVLYFLFIYSITNTWYVLRPKLAKVFMITPFAIFSLLLCSNFVTGMCFTVTSTEGYKRGPLILVFYGIASLYVIFGLAHLVSSKRYLPFQKWFSILSVYLFTYAAVVIQFIDERLLVEMLASSLGLLFIELLVLRPEEVIDSVVGLQSWAAYQETLRKIMITHQRVQILVIRFINAREVRAYLGEERYVKYIKLIADKTNALARREKLHCELFFEHPGSLYLIFDEYDFNAEEQVPKLRGEIEKFTQELKGTGAKLNPRVCAIHYPDAVDDMKEIIHLGHHFTELIPHDQIFIEAEDISKTMEFQIINNMREILTRAIENQSFEVYYQPIYSIWDKKFISAEALLRLDDEKFGSISPALFIPEAERRGLILPVGDFVLDEVHRFASENGLEDLGLSYIEINLSVAQCLERDLPDKLSKLRNKYKVGPEKVNLEITETSYSDIGKIMDDNLKILSEQGYSFSLDDYGVGYSNIQRVSQLPLKIIKIDKSLVDNMNTTSGKSIMNNTVRMMKDIKKELVIEGVETKEDFEELKKMGCDFIQGFYFSKPLPGKEFLEFLRKHNLEAS